MKKEKLMHAGGLWLTGAALFGLRLLQLRNGFDPDTGLAIPSLAGRILWIGLLVVLAVDLLLGFRRPREGKRSYACCFAPLEGGTLGGLAAGSFLLIAGGVLLLVSALPSHEAVPMAAGVLGIAGGAGLLLMAKELRSGGAPTALPLLPGMFFSVVFVLAVYLPEESNPVLGRFYLPVLAACLAAYFFYQLSGFTHREGSIRWFDFMGHAAAGTCIAAMADCMTEFGRLLIYLGYAVTATVFLLLLREEPLAEPVEAEEEAEVPEETQP